MELLKFIPGLGWVAGVIVAVLFGQLDESAHSPVKKTEAIASVFGFYLMRYRE